MTTSQTLSRRVSRLLFVAAGCGAASLAAAEPPQMASCRACHGRHGISDSPDIPNLAGQKAGYLARQLEAFRSGERRNSLMAAVAAQLSEADIRSLAQAWSQLDVRAAPADAGASTAIRSRQRFPAAFPEGFTLYETSTDPASGQLVKRYANRLALQAAREGRAMPSGAVIVVANHAKPAAANADTGNALSYASMAAQAGWGEAVPALLRNGDWDYALFNANRVRRDSVNTAACLACHKPVAADSFVFTMAALKAAALAQPR